MKWFHDVYFFTDRAIYRAELPLPRELSDPHPRRLHHRSASNRYRPDCVPCEDAAEVPRASCRYAPETAERTGREASERKGTIFRVERVTKIWTFTVIL